LSRDRHGGPVFIARLRSCVASIASLRTLRTNRFLSSGRYFHHGSVACLQRMPAHEYLANDFEEHIE
jgi:hypothetical protein